MLGRASLVSTHFYTPTTQEMPAIIISDDIEKIEASAVFVKHRIIKVSAQSS